VIAPGLRPPCAKGKHPHAGVIASARYGPSVKHCCAAIDAS
jgi:hypothetical protein